MARRKRRTKPTLPDDWTVHESYQVHGRWLTKGTEVSIRGERGRFRFIKAVERPGGILWLDFVGGPKHHAQWRSFGPERVKTVHRIAKTRENQLKEQASD